ncbi:hypothetical protein COO60DRAFT_1266157 [Scenedesmus sp. NREL 46B-D3]|nr:hypothetical protein COO60DRAFT_1266157 [Scenedesmus sp. NREL 46B-D3]
MPTSLSGRASVEASSSSGSSRSSSSSVYFMGVDFGTSGARVTVIDGAGSTAADYKQGYGPEGPADWAAAWHRVLFELVAALPRDIVSNVGAVAFDGTSATAMLVDAATGQQLAPPKLYNEAQGAAAVAAAKAIAPASHTATAATSTLCKVLMWHLAGTWQAAAAAGATPRLMHQADWLAYLLHGRPDVSDWNNALKLGFDPAAEAYPQWLSSQEYACLFPSTVVAPSAPVASITAAAASSTGLPPSCLVCGGTTDSIAAFVAAGVSETGEAVTSLGSTMAVKLLSEARVDDAAYGVYSHRLGNSWLVGGASNTGGAVLRQHFSNEQLQELTQRIHLAHPSGLDYYPLLGAGERFPVNDPGMQPRLLPRPEDDALFLQGMLESMARIEAQAYRLLAQLGASKVTSVLTAGGGAVNDKWTAMRAAALEVPVQPAQQGEASYGAALLARAGWRQQNSAGQQHQHN